MNRPKSGKPSGRNEPIEDPGLLQDCLHLLLDSGAEFSIKVEGTSTLPYAAMLEKVEAGGLILKLVRPLPHELMGGAIFRVVFAVEDQRYEALITYGGREAYLQYRFSQPEHLFLADRRRHKRYPFRPRESAFVMASDGGIPGMGIAGPLVNIGLGGLCLRVDRVLKLDDGLRIPASTALFERNASFPRIRIQELPRVPIFEVSGWVSHASERGSEVLLGLDFGELSEEPLRILSDCLAFREKVFQSRGSSTGLESHSAVRVDSPDPSEEARPLEGATDSNMAPDPLGMLWRRTARLILISEGGELMERTLQRLWDHGFHRVEVAKDCEAARVLWQEPGRALPQLVMGDLALAEPEPLEPLVAVRSLEQQLADFKGASVVILCDKLEPTMFFGQSGTARILPLSKDEGPWIKDLEDLLGIGDGFSGSTPLDGS